MRLLPVPKEVPIDQFFRTSLAAWLMTSFGVLIAPFVEELFFRGMLFPALARRTGVLLAMIVTAAGFAIIHADQLGKNWALVLAIFGVGLAFTLIRYFSGSLAASVLSHMSYNGLIFALAFAQTGGFRHMERMAR
jgi:membrane protease YdiL (CAAX protease family)